MSKTYLKSDHFNGGGSAAANRWCRPRIIGLCRARCASCNGCSVRRRWKPRSSRRRSNMPRGQKKTAAAAAVVAEGQFPMTTVAEVIGVSRSNLMEHMRERPKQRIGRRPLPDGKLVAEIKAVIAELPTYGYRRVHAMLKRQALAAGLKPPNHKRVYRVMKVHGLLLDRHAGGVERRHDGISTTRFFATS